MEKKENLTKLDLTNKHRQLPPNTNPPAISKRLNFLILLILFASTLAPSVSRAQSPEPDALQDPGIAAPEPPYVSASGAAIPEPTTASNIEATPAWVEPRGLSIVDLVGLVPEEQLRGAIIRYWAGLSLTLYQWGRRDGDTVTIHVKYTEQWPGIAFCLGKPGQYDEWPVVVPESRMRVFEHGVDITSRVANFYYFPAGLTQPTASTSNYRYPEYNAPVRFDASGAVIVPANSGCSYFMHNTGADLEAEFTFHSPPVISVQQLGSQSTKFHSYIGPGSVGRLDSLRNQMQSRFGNRHEDFRISPPAGTNYILVRYPLIPEDPYGPNGGVPGAGTYRVRRANTKLSVDHVNTMGIPYYSQWQDADQSGGADFLPYFTDGIAIATPEYVLPDGIPYQSCMTDGGCPSTLLDAIYRAEMQLTVYFYNVQTTVAGLTVIPLRQVGPGYGPNAAPVDVSPASDTAVKASTFPDDAPSAIDANSYRIYLPGVSRPAPTMTYTGSNCPCGIFTSDGRMVGFLPQSN